MDEHDLCAGRNFCQRMPHRVLPFGAAGHDLRHFCKSMFCDDLALAIIDVRGRNGENDLVDHRCSLQGQQGLDDERLAAQRQKLFRDGTAHPKAAPGSGHESDHLIGHWFLSRGIFHVLTAEA